MSSMCLYCHCVIEDHSAVDLSVAIDMNVWIGNHQSPGQAILSLVTSQIHVNFTETAAVTSPLSSLHQRAESSNLPYM